MAGDAVPPEAIRLVLWDVDHTLMEGGPTGKAIYRVAFERLTGRTPVEGPHTDGRTDLAITSDLFAVNGMALPDHTTLVEALAASAASLREQLAAHGRALSGATGCPTALAATPGVVQSVLTGNIEANARLKLATFGLDGWLDFAIGGYGSDSIVRADLVAIARRKAQARLGRGLGRQTPVVAPVLIGDTPRNVEAGRGGGARVIAVATGAFIEAELLSAGADCTLPSLTDVQQVLAALETVSPNLMGGSCGSSE